MGLGTIVLIILILMLVSVLPTWPHSRSWGHGPSGLLGPPCRVHVGRGDFWLGSCICSSWNGGSRC